MSTNNNRKFKDAYLPRVRIYSIRVPKDKDWDPERAVMLLQHILTQFGYITFCIQAEAEQIVWQVLDLWNRDTGNTLAQAIASIDPEVDIEIAPYHPREWTGPFYRSLVLYRQAADFVAPMKYVSELKALDRLTSLVHGMSGLRPGERIVYQLHILGEISESLLQAAQKRITVSQIHPLQFLSIPGASYALGHILNGNTRAPRYQAKDQHLLEEHLRHGQHYNTSMMIQMDTQEEAALARISNLSSSVWQFSSDFNGLYPLESIEETTVHVKAPDQEFITSGIGQIAAWFDGTDLSFPQKRVVLSTYELAALWHLPHEGFTAPEIRYRADFLVPPPMELTSNSQGICLGIGWLL